jgi:anti-sigma28 factor (negative regulator of flagellin synthesis)
MKVESYLLNISMPQNDRVQGPLKAEGGSSTRTQSAQTSGDGVDLGSQAGLVAAAQTAGQTDQSSLVQSLRALVQSGQYQVDTASLSQAIVASAGDGF